MTDSLTVAVEEKKSRRGLLALVGAGGAAAVAALLGRTNEAKAAVGDALKLGQSNDSGAGQTYVECDRDDRSFYVRNNNTGSSAGAIWGHTDGGGPALYATSSNGPGVEATTWGSSTPAVRAEGGGTNGAGVHGRATGANATGVKGYSDLGTGVKGESAASGSPWELAGVHGTSSAGTGVLGQSSDFIGVHGTSDNSDGVRGDAAGSGAAGVAGISSGGIGVRGSGGMGVYGGASDGGFGVYGHSPSNTGVYGTSDSGTGVKGVGKPGVHGMCYSKDGSGVRGDGSAPGSIGLYGTNAPDRRALRTKGRVQMDTARKVTLSNRSNLIKLPTGVNAGAFAIVLAMVQGASGNGAFVRRAWRVDDKHIRITFDQKPANPTAVGYWVVQTG